MRHLFVFLVLQILKQSTLSLICVPATTVRQHLSIRSRQCGSPSPSAAFLFTSNNDYGRGSEIWPPTNTDRAVQLQDSFPNGNIPAEALEALGQSASSDPDQHKKSANTWLDRFPGFLVVTMLTWTRPLDIGLVATLSLYTAILTLAASSSRETLSNNDNNVNVPTLPSLPPHGHVPHLVQNPMLDLSYSTIYDLWWRLGIGLGFLLPSLTMVYGLLTFAVSSSYSILATVARPLFLLSCQAVSELLCKDWLIPLPIRIWIPISYQVIRLGYLGVGLWGLLAAGATLSPSSTLASVFLSWVQLLTGLNLLYTVVNVFAFLLPVALMRYMRAHFFAVEAASVTVHRNMEETLGVSTPGSSSAAKGILEDK